MWKVVFPSHVHCGDEGCETCHETYRRTVVASYPGSSASLVSPLSLSAPPPDFVCFGPRQHATGKEKEVFDSLDGGRSGGKSQRMQGILDWDMVVLTTGSQIKVVVQGENVLWVLDI